MLSQYTTPLLGQSNNEMLNKICTFWKIRLSDMLILATHLLVFSHNGKLATSGHSNGGQQVELTCAAPLWIKLSLSTVTHFPYVVLKSAPSRWDKHCMGLHIIHGSLWSHESTSQTSRSVQPFLQHSQLSHTHRQCYTTCSTRLHPHYYYTRLTASFSRQRG